MSSHIPSLDCAVDRTVAEPLVQQVYRQLRDLVLAGRVPAGSRLPSTRDLAHQMGVSRTVTLAAYDQLIAEGYLESRRGSGAWVRRIVSAVRESRAVEPLSNDQTPSPAEHRIFDPAGQPTDMFDSALWARLLGRGWRKEGEIGVSSGTWRGLPSLRLALAQHLRMFRGIECSPDEVFITGGNADALQMIGKAVAKQARCRSAWVEDPTYISACTTLAREGLEIRPIPVDGEGLCVDVGLKVDPDAALALVTPSRQFPLCMQLSLERRLALIRWSRDRGALLVEDDYDCELRFSGRPIPSLMALDPDADILSIGSLSKLTFPGLRLGYVVGPRRWIDRLVEMRARQGAPVATAAQPALGEYIGDGLLAKHLRALRIQVGQRRDALIGMLRRELRNELEILPQHAGMHLTVRLAGGLKDTVVARAGGSAGLQLEPLSEHYLKAKPLQGFILGYSAWPEAELARGVATLKELLTRN